MDTSTGAKVGHNSGGFRVEVVTTPAQMRMVFAVRALAFMEDTGLPYNHAFDGNDFQATHILAFMGDEPIGAQRIRYFKDFAKIERTGFRKAYRDPRYLKRGAQFTFAHIARKGYTRVITHAEPKYVEMWCRLLGFQPVKDKPPAYFHGEPHIELERELTAPADVISHTTDIKILFRTEGAWDRPDPFEEI